MEKGKGHCLIHVLLYCRHLTSLYLSIRNIIVIIDFSCSNLLAKLLNANVPVNKI